MKEVPVTDEAKKKEATPPARSGQSDQGDRATQASDTIESEMDESAEVLEGAEDDTEFMIPVDASQKAGDDAKAADDKKAEDDKKAAEAKKAADDKKAKDDKKVRGEKKATDDKKVEDDKKAAAEKKAADDKKAEDDKKAAAEKKEAPKTKFEIRVPTNAELAENLKGRLLLVHGELDNNVHPANTLRLVDALIKANKRFDMLYLPGKRHAYADYQDYVNQRMMEYFAEHLLGDYQPTANLGEKTPFKKGD